MNVKHNLGRTQAARNRRLTSSTCSSRISDTRSSTSRRRLTGQTRPIINNIRRISTNNSFLQNENVALASSLKPAAVRNLEPRSNSSYRGHYEKEIEVYKVNLFGGGNSGPFIVPELIFQIKRICHTSARQSRHVLCRQIVFSYLSGPEKLSASFCLAQTF